MPWASGGAGALPGVGGAAHGSRVYISGQADKAASAREAAAKTIESLLATLKFVGCDARDVRQAKSFLTPMSAADDVREEFNKVFRGADLPVVFVEWKSDSPIEIELVADAPRAAADAPAIEYLTPPGKTTSPLFARVVRVNRGDTIYIGDLSAKQPGNGEAQVLSIFEQLQEILKDSGSDLRHLAKATYYVSDDDASKKLNELRPKFYDPQRPPAASKAMVPAVGLADRSITIDMIAIPTTQPTTPAPKP
jgi:enamine deaminase RidA (YjgF/YER057c/UK114 family)